LGQRGALSPVRVERRRRSLPMDGWARRRARVRAARRRTFAIRNAGGSIPPAKAGTRAAREDRRQRDRAGDGAAESARDHHDRSSPTRGGVEARAPIETGATEGSVRGAVRTWE